MNFTSYPNTPRLINKFALGADPEFVMHSKEGVYKSAELLGLNTLRAFGCDMSGRQAEIRACPSRFALEVVASIVDTLRWMSKAHGYSVTQYNWLALTYNNKDGCGGHVHFGRRKPNKDKDLRILDDLTTHMVVKDIFNSLGFIKRQANTHYGQYGDMRLQSHGYEYRTFPTQLDNPWLMYFTLVMSKLSIFEGNECFMTGTNLTESPFISLLEKYKGLDDDAAIALMMYKREGFPKQSGKDFKEAWGILSAPIREPQLIDRCYYPSVIKPTELTKRQVFDRFVHGVALPLSVPEANWLPYKLVQGCEEIEVSTHSLGHLPDIGMDLLAHRSSVDIRSCSPFAIRTNIKLPQLKIRRALRKVSRCQFQYAEFETSRIIVDIPKFIKDSRMLCKRVKEVLSNTELFPICKAKDYNQINWTDWNFKLLQPCNKKIDRQSVTIEGTSEIVVPKIRKSGL